MISSLRPVLPLFDFTAPRWGSSIRLRPRHVFHAHRPLSHGRHSAKEKEISLKVWRFPRGSWSYPDKIQWVTRQVLILPVGFVLMFGSRLGHCCRSWILGRSDKGIDFNSRAGWLLCDLGSGCVRLLAVVVEPWGMLNLSEGPSMQPTLPTSATPTYASFVYDKRDIRRGDVVVAMVLKPDGGTQYINKRVAALEGDRIRVTMCSRLKVPHSIVHVRYSSVISLLSSVFTYGHIGTDRTLLSSWG